MYRPSIHSSTHSFIRPAHHPLRHLPTPVGKRTWAEAHTAGSGRPLKTGRVLFGPRPVSRLRAGGADRFLCVSVTLAKATCFLHLLFKVEHLVVKKIFRPLPFTRGPLRSQLNRVAFQDTHVAFRSSTTSVLNTASKPEVTRTWSKADEHRVPPPHPAPVSDPPCQVTVAERGGVLVRNRPRQDGLWRGPHGSSVASGPVSMPLSCVCSGG